MNDNLSLSFYFAQNGVPLYPNCRGGADSVNEEYLQAFPKNTLIALGAHGFVRLKEQKQEWRVWIETIIKKLEPKGLIIVGHLPKEIILTYQNFTNLYVFDSLIEERRKEQKAYVH